MFGRPSERDDARAASWAAWFRRQNVYALASVPLGVFSLTHAGTLLVDGAAGVVLGFVALWQLDRVRAGLPGYDGTRVEGRGLAWAGILVGGASLALAAYVYLFLPAAVGAPAAGRGAG